MSLYGCNVFPFAWVGDFVHVQQLYAVQDGIPKHFEPETPSSHAKSSHKEKCCGIKVNEGIKQVSKEKTEELKKYKLSENDILLARRGDLTKCAIVSKRHINKICGTGSFFLHLILVSAQFFRFVYSSDYVQNILKKDCVGATMDNLNQSVLANIFFPVPPLKEQMRIVKYLEYNLSLLDTIENDKKSLQTVINQAKSKILDLAIHGKLVPQDPNDEPASELLKRINPKAEIACDNPRYGKLPKGWCICRLKDMAKVITGSTPSKLNKEYYGGNFPFYKPADLDLGRHVNKASEYLTQAGKDVSRLVPPGTTAVCCIGSIGKVGFLEYEGTTNQQINCAIPSECLDNEYLYYSCSSQWFYSSLIAESSAVTISIVNKSKMENVVMPLPPLQEQHRIVAKIEELFTQLDKIESSL